MVDGGLREGNVRVGEESGQCIQLRRCDGGDRCEGVTGLRDEWYRGGGERLNPLSFFSSSPHSSLSSPSP